MRHTKHTLLIFLALFLISTRISWAINNESKVSPIEIRKDVKISQGSVNYEIQKLALDKMGKRDASKSATFSDDTSTYLLTDSNGFAAVSVGQGTYDIDVNPIEGYELKYARTIVVGDNSYINKIGVSVSRNEKNKISIVPPGSRYLSNVAAFQVFADYNSDGIQQADEPNLQWHNVGVVLTKRTNLYKYFLIDGWSLVAFPFSGMDYDHASTLLALLNSQGADVTTIARWMDGDYQEYVVRGTDKFGTDFPIEANVGYFLRNHKATRVEIYGNRLEKSSNLVLNKGYNLVGINSNQALTAKSLIEKSNKLLGGERVIKTVTRFDSGLLEPFVKENSKEYGFDFPINPFRGYFLNVRQNTNLSL